MSDPAAPPEPNGPSTPRACPGRLGTLSILLIVVVAAAVGQRLWGPRARSAAIPPEPSTPAQLILALERAAAADSNPREAYEGLGAACLKLGHFMSARVAFQRARELGSNSAWLRQQLAWCALHLDRREEALATYRQLVEDEQQAPEAYLRFAAAALRMGEGGTSRESLRSMPPSVARALLQIGESPGRAATANRERYLTLLLDSGLPQEALSAAARVLAESPRDPAALIVAARACATLKQWPDALHHTDAALALLPNRADLHALRGDALTALGDGQDARRHTGFGARPPASGGRRASGAQGASLSYRRAIELQPSLGPVQFRLARIARVERRWEEARRGFLTARALGTEPNAALREAARSAEAAGQPRIAARHWGEYHELVGDIEAARRAYTLLLSDSRSHLDGTLRLADLDARNNRRLDAMRRLDDALKQYPDNPELLRARARAYRAHGRTHDAIGAWTQVARVAPDHAGEAHRELAGIYEGLGDFDAAEREYAAATRQQPMDSALRRLYGTLLLLRRQQGDRLVRAIAELEQAATLAPEDASPLVDLARAYEAAGRQEEARLALRHAIDLAPGSGPPYQDLGRIARRLGREAESREAMAMYRLYRAAQREVEGLKAIVSARSTDPRVRLRLAEFYVRARDFTRAATEFERSLALGATAFSASERADIRERLATIYERLSRREDAAALRAGSRGAKR